jgi:serine/threonine protein kinase
MDKATIIGSAGPDEVLDTIARDIARSLGGDPDAAVFVQHELLEPSTGRRYPLPLMVSSRSGITLVHLVRGEGALSPTEAAWTWRRGSARTTEPAPFAEANELARRLRERLHAGGQPGLAVEARVLLCHPLHLDAGATLQHPMLCRRESNADGLLPALLSVLEAAPTAVDRPTPTALQAALHAAHIMPARHATLIGGYRLGGLLNEGEHWQEYAATADADPAVTARVRLFTVRGASDPERKQSLRRAAEREAELLRHVGACPSILRLHGTHALGQDGPPALVFEPFTGGVDLRTFLDANPHLPFDPRLDLVLALAQAVERCHRHDITLRNLSTRSVLVRKSATGGVELRLHHFEGAVARFAEASTLGTRHLDWYTAPVDRAFAAPERLDGNADTVATDLYSLGAVAYFIFSGALPSEGSGGLPGLRQRVLEGEGLRLRDRRDDIDARLDELVARATHPEAAARPDSAQAWSAALLRDLRPHAADPQHFVPALTATPGDWLDADLQVESVLGEGSTARVLAVRWQGELCALKVPLDADVARMVSAEKVVLEALHADGSLPHLVRPLGAPRLEGRPALLLSWAGPRTLGAELRRSGALSLDFCQTLGDQLYATLGELHARGVQHRDIKPDNMAFSSIGHSARELCLFDLSLSALDGTQVRAGTAEWRDPHLAARGAWDSAADLYAAALVLYYALVGERPTQETRTGRHRLVAELYDPALRGALETFFKRATDPDPARRHRDAAEARRAWLGLFADDRTSLAPKADLSALALSHPESPLGSLGLSARAANALSRAGCATARDVVLLERNLLGLLPGVGGGTRAEIGEVIGLLRERFASRPDLDPTAFLPGLDLPAVDLAAADPALPDALALGLRAGGLSSLSQIGTAQAARVSRIAEAAGSSAEALRSLLLSQKGVTPGLLGELSRTLLSPRPRGAQWRARLALLFGQKAPPEGLGAIPRGLLRTRELAPALGVKTSDLHNDLKKAREHWASEAASLQLAEQAVAAALDAQGGLCPLPELAAALVARLAPTSPNRAEAEAEATALVRLVAVARPEAPPVHLRRLGPGGTVGWAATTAAALDALSRLAADADALVNHEEVVDPSAARSALAAALPPFAATPFELLLPRLGLAISRAALSTRNELYRRGLSAERALRLIAPALHGDQSPEDLQRRLRARFPEAEALPARPALDRLAEAAGLLWVSDAARYRRPGAAQPTSLQSLLTTGSTGAAGPWTDPEHRADSFALRLRGAWETGGFRALRVSARLAPRAAALLLDRFPALRHQSLDKVLLEALRAEIAEAEADARALLALERQGPSGAHWGDLHAAFFVPAFARVTAGWAAAPATPLLLTDPGLLARWGLQEPLRTFIDSVNERGSIRWLLLPTYDDHQPAHVAHPTLGPLPIPTQSPAHQLRVSGAWLNLGS